MNTELFNKFSDIINSVPVKGVEAIPSEWAEEHRKLTSEVSNIQGPFKYDYTPYLREIIDTLSPYSPAKVIAVMKGSQIGFTEGVIINGIPWLIANAPGNIFLTSANEDLNKELIEQRLDQAIASCGIQHLIRPNTIRKKNQRTGDTSKYKEFTGGRLYAGGVNSTDKMSRQRSVKYGFFDDWDAAPISDKDQGSLFDILQKRFSTAKNSMKQYYISTPEERPSNIENVYLMGDQRKWHVPCPLCGDYIEMLWSETDKDGERVGVVFSLDKKGELIKDSVGYKCQSCGGFFDETHKYEINMLGKWKPSAKPVREGYQSYYIPNLMAAPFMYGWEDFAHEWLAIHKDGITRKNKLKVFMNQTLGLPWENKKTEVKASQLSENTRRYQVGIVPRKQSLDDGNGDVILLTCACDLNGTMDDARMDWEVVGHSESGSTYNVCHGSIGTYTGGKKTKADEKRNKWTYRNGEADNVWQYFYDEVINAVYPADDGSEMLVMLTAVDTGYYTSYAYSFIDQFSDGKIIGVKGRMVDRDKYQKKGADVRLFRPAKERPRLYILEVEHIKDSLADRMMTKWFDRDQPQPPGFMNFPEPSGGQYTMKGYFKQYEAEERKIDTDDNGEPIGWKWVRKHSSMANHFFDCMVYNLAARDIVAEKICQSAKIRNGNWADFVDFIKKAGY